MTENLVYIDDQLIDLKPGTKIVYTYQNTLIGSLTTRRVSYTNSIPVPFTEINDRTFTFKRNEKAKQQFVSQRARLVQNGREIVSNGLAIVNRVNGNYELSIYDGISTFFESLGDSKIDELYSIDTNLITWDAAKIDDKRDSTTGIVSPVISYGQLRPGTQLTNNEFTGSLSGWEQVNLNLADSGNPQFPTLVNKSWGPSSNMAVAQLETFYSATNGTYNGYTKVLRQAYKLAKGQQYNITIDGRYNNAGGGQSTDIYARLYLQDGITYTDYFVATFTSSFADHAIQIIPEKDYYYFGIWTQMTYDGPTASTTADPEVRDVTIEVELTIGDVYLPSHWYKDLIFNTITDQGYSSTSDILSNDILLRLVLPFSKDDLKYTGLFNKCREVKARLSAPQTLTVDGNVIFDEIVTKDLYGYYDPTDGYYSQNNDYEYEIDPSSDTRSFYSKFNASIEVLVNSGSAIIQLLSQGDGVLDQSILSAPGRYTVNLSVNKFGATSSKGYNMASGDTVSVYCDLTAANITILRGEFWNYVDGINQDETPLFYACELLPEIKKKDLFKDLFLRFGIIPKEKNRILYFKTFEEVISDKITAIDWTDKHDTSFDDDISYDDEYVQNNYFRYPSNDEFYNDATTKGNIICDNATLETEQDLYESIFNGSLDILVGDNVNYVYCGYIPIWDVPPTAYPTEDNNPFDHQPGLRLMVLRDKEAAESDIKFDGNSRSDYKVANFVLPNENYLNWQGFLDEHYPSLANAIRQNKSIVRRYNLNEDDIAKLDPHKLMYDNGSYFIINRVPNFDSELEESTKVELFKVQ